MKDKNPTGVKGVVPEGHSFMRKASTQLLKTAPEAKRMINSTIKLEKDVKYLGLPCNVFSELPNKDSPGRKRLREQTLSSLHPGYHNNIDLKMKQLEKKQMGLTTISTSSGRTLEIPRKVVT